VGQVLGIGQYELLLEAAGGAKPSATPVRRTLPKYMLLVVHPGQQEPTVYALHGPTHTVGRSTTSNIVVPFSTIDATHLVLNVNESCRIKVVNSLNGTYLGSNPLLPGDEREWKPGVPVRTLDCTFELIDWSALTGGDVDLAVVGAQDAPGGGISAHPGSTLQIEVRLKIPAEIKRVNYLVCAVGQPSSWPVKARSVGLLAGGSDERPLVELEIPPNEVADRYPLLLIVLRLREQQSWQVVRCCPLDVVVAAVPNLEHDWPAAPPPLRLGRSQPLSLTNSGNVPLAVTVEPNDQRHDLAFELLETEESLPLHLAVGETGTLRIRPGLEGRRGALRYVRVLGSPATYEFATTVEAASLNAPGVPPIQKSLPVVRVKSIPLIPKPFDMLLLLLLLLLGALLVFGLRPTVKIAAAGDCGQAAGQLCVQESGMGSTEIKVRDRSNRSVETVTGDFSVHLQPQNVGYSVPISPGHQLEVQRSLLGYNSPMTATTIPLQPNEIVSVTVTPASVLCGIGEKIVLTVVLTRPLETGESLHVDLDSRRLPIAKDKDQTEYSYPLDDLLKEAIEQCDDPAKFDEVTVSVKAVLEQVEQAPEAPPVILMLRPAKCRLVSGASIHTGPYAAYPTPSEANLSSEVRIIGNLVRLGWVPIRPPQYGSPLWVMKNSLDCSADPAVMEALEAERFQDQTPPDAPTPTFTPVAPTPVPGPTPPTPVPPIPSLPSNPDFKARFRAKPDDPARCVPEGTGFLSPDITGIWLYGPVSGVTLGDMKKACTDVQDPSNNPAFKAVTTVMNGDTTTGALEPSDFTTVSCQKTSDYLLRVDVRNSAPSCDALVVVQ
jgi:hypothetical protein